MKSVLIAFLSCCLSNCIAQQKSTKEITGELSIDLFSSDAELRKWYVAEYNQYMPDSISVKELTVNLSDKIIVVVLGTWCSDSQELFPRFTKVMNSIAFPKEKLMVYGVNKDKTTPADIISRYNIVSVPTFIVLNSVGTEQGRVVETVHISIEAELLALFK